MKKYALITILIITIIMPGALHGNEGKDPSALLERARQAMRLPQATVTDMESGTTSLDGVYFFLCKGRFPNTVDGIAIARKGALRDDIALSVNDAKGDLLFSCTLGAESERGYSIFFFTLNKEFVSGATITLHSQGRLSELKLSKLPPRTQTCLELGDLVKMISTRDKKNANKTIDSDKK